MKSAGETALYRKRFGRYARPFLSKTSQRDRQAMGLKLVHSERVRKTAKQIAQSEGLGGRMVFLAELCGLFHDIGRLPQFRRYKTFSDARSEDHAALGIEVIQENQMLSGLPPEEERCVKDAIFVHNKLVIPEDFHGRTEVLSKILRDADKIDIWRVFDDYYRKGVGAEEINLGLPPGEEISPAVMENLLADTIVRIEYVRSQLDFMVMRLSWLYDINYRHALGIIVKRNYIQHILERLPEGREKDAITRKITALVQERLE